MCESSLHTPSSHSVVVVVAAMASDPLPGRSLRPRALHKVLLPELHGAPDGTDDEGQE